MIPVFVSSDSEIYEESLAGLQSVVQFSIDLQYLEILQAEIPDLQAYLQELDDRELPFVITVGVNATRTLYGSLKKTPVVFSMVNTPKSLGLQPGKICGVSMDTPASEFFSVLREIDPSVRFVAGFYSAAGRQSALEGEFHDISHGVLYKASEVTRNDDFSQVLAKEADRAAGVLMTPDPLYSRENFLVLSNYGREQKKIIMTGFASLVKLGATFGLSPDYARVGIQTAEMANLIYNGSSTCASEFIRLPEHHSLFINEEYAKAQGIQIPEPILARAKLTGLFSIGIALIKEEKLEPARLIFEKILEQDPENKAANVYLDVIIERQTGDKTRALLSQAQSLMQSGRFTQAGNKYREVLVLNPKNQKARAGLNDSIASLSEEYRRNGAGLAVANKPFEAIRAYLSSLRVLSSNSRAQQELNSLRNRESGKINDYFETGLGHYNRREYVIAIEIFENILLVNPAHKKSAEYLRLSQQKKVAADRLLEKYRSGN